MIEYKDNANNNIVEISIEGKITKTDFDRVVSQLTADIQKYGKLKILEEINNFQGIDLLVLWKDLKFGMAHFNDFTHAAVVADPKWMRTFAETIGKVFSVEIKAFECSQIEEARTWLQNA